MPILPTGGISTSDRLGESWPASGQVWVTAHTSGSSSRVAASDERAYRCRHREPAPASRRSTRILQPPVPSCQRDRDAPRSNRASLVTLRSHPCANGRTFKPSTGPRLSFRSNGRHGHRIPTTTPWACPPGGAGLMNGWRGSTIRPERVGLGASVGSRSPLPSGRSVLSTNSRRRLGGLAATVHGCTDTVGPDAVGKVLVHADWVGASPAQPSSGSATPVMSTTMSWRSVRRRRVAAPRARRIRRRVDGPSERTHRRDDFVSLVDLTHGRAFVRLTGDDASRSAVQAVRHRPRRRGHAEPARLALIGGKVVTDVVRDDFDGTRSYLLHCERSSGQCSTCSSTLAPSSDSRSPAA